MADGICDGCGEFYALRSGEDDTDHCDSCWGWNQALEAALAAIPGGDTCRPADIADAIRELIKRTDEADEDSVPAQRNAP